MGYENMVGLHQLPGCETTPRARLCLRHHTVWHDRVLYGTVGYGIYPHASCQLLVAELRSSHAPSPSKNYLINTYEYALLVFDLSCPRRLELSHSFRIYCAFMGSYYKIYNIKADAFFSTFNHRSGFVFRKRLSAFHASRVASVDKNLGGEGPWYYGKGHTCKYSNGTL